MKKKIVAMLLVCSLLTAGIIISNKFNTKATNSTEVFTNSDTIPTGMDEKESIHYKMLNSIDFFDNAEGAFTYYTKSSNNTLSIEYSVDEKNNKSYTKSRSSPSKSNIDDSIEECCNNGKILKFYNDNKSYRELQCMPLDNSHESIRKLKPKERYSKREDGSTEYIVRQDPTYMGIASSVLFNENIALGFLEDYNNWDICEKEIYLGINCTKLTGSLNDYYNQKLLGNNFSILVDEITGILLKLEVTNNNKEVVFSIISSNITINNGIHNEKIEKSTLGYTKLIK